MRFEIQNGPETGASFYFKDETDVIIGRGLKCDITLKDAEASRQHAKVSVVNDQVWIEDLESRNGTQVNGSVVQRHLLKEGDRLGIGNVQMRITDIQTGSASGTKLNVGDSVSQVLVTMDQREADLSHTETETGIGEDLARENRMLREVCEISQIVASGNDADDVIRQIVDSIRGILNADNACILDVAEGDATWDVIAASSRAGAASTVNVSRTIIQEAIEKNIAILSKDPTHDERFDPSQSIVMHNISSAICAPLTVHDRAEGVIFIDRRSRTETFDAFDLRIAATVTNMLALYMEKERFEADARAKEKLAVVGEVVAGLAHYAKNLIMGLEFSLASVRRHGEREGDDALGARLDAVEFQEKRVSGLIMDMLSYAKDREPLFADVDLRVTLEQTVSPYREHLGVKGITIDLDFAEDLPCIHAEDRSLHRVFLNLMTNAIHAVESREDGPKTITIRAGRAEQPSEVEIQFADSGTGIPEDKLEKIFTAFFSTKGSGGTGLGLAVVQKIIHEHRGRITVGSVIDQGTTFVIRLPILPPEGGTQTGASE